MLDDRQLVALHQGGDPDAFAEIYRRTRGDVYAYILHRVHDRELAEDLTHDTFVRALKRIDGWQWQGKEVGAWLYTIASRLVIDHHRSARRRYEVKTDDAETAEGRPDDSPEGRPEDTVIAHLRYTALLDALRSALQSQSLTRLQRACIVHRFVEELSVAETAAAMGRGKGAVRALQFRASTVLECNFDTEAWQ